MHSAIQFFNTLSEDIYYILVITATDRVTDSPSDFAISAINVV